MPNEHVPLQMGFLVKGRRAKIAEKRFFLVTLVLLVAPQAVRVHVLSSAHGAFVFSSYLSF